MKARITSKGQVTVPRACREKLGLRTGTILDFEAVDGVLVESPDLASGCGYIFDNVATGDL